MCGTHLLAAQPASGDDTITTLIISGNKITERSTVEFISGISVGMRFDSSLITDARTRLRRTDLFYKVDILSLRTTEGYRIYIILAEKFYILPYDLGGELYSRRYGREKRWWRLRVGMENVNFRGKAETLRIGCSIWDWRSVSASWTKPFLPSPWYFSVGAAIDKYPDEVFAIDHLAFRTTMTTGRKLPFNSLADLSVMPLIRRRLLHGPGNMGADTVRIYEAFSLLRWRTDYRNTVFDPSEGWYLALDMRTNALYNGIAPCYAQLSGDVRWYSRGLAPSHTVACRMTSTLRNRDAGVTHRLQLGGEGTIRGYARSQFGLLFIANNSLTLSMEYRFPIMRFPDMDLFLLRQFNPAFSSISYRLDGALILDCGRVSTDFTSLVTHSPDKSENGTGLGAGLRIVTPTFERSVCFDLVWGTYPWSHDGYISFMKEPAWHFYLDMFF